MSVPNIGPERPDDLAGADGLRKGNPALVYRDEPVTDEVEAASTRASAVSNRFGGPRYALTRRIHADRLRDFTLGGDSDASQ